jgi:uncharacterized membrane protein YuzA (DUF378 family)
MKRFPRAMLVCVALIFGIGTMLQQIGAISINDDIFYSLIGICAGILIITAVAMRRNEYRKSAVRP